MQSAAVGQVEITGKDAHIGRLEELFPPRVNEGLRTRERRKSAQAQIWRRSSRKQSLRFVAQWRSVNTKLAISSRPAVELF